MAGITRTYWRRILASSAVYAAAGWAVVEAVTTVVERFELPESFGPIIIAAYLAGLPVTVYLVWRTAGKQRRLTWPSFLGSMCLLIAGTAAIFWFTRPAPVETPTVAVLPCVVESDHNLQGRGDGFAEDIHGRLSLVDSIRIISWNSSLYVRERQLGPQQAVELLSANRLLECHMRSGTDRIAVTTRLLDPASDRVLWNREFDFMPDELGVVVTEIAGTVLQVLATPVEAAEMEQINDIGTFSPRAYDLYLQARGMLTAWRVRSTRDINADAETLLGQALELDPNYAEAMVALAYSYLERVINRDFEEIEELRVLAKEARELSQRAIDLKPRILHARWNLSRVCRLLGEYLGEPCDDGEEHRLRLEECEVRGETAEGWMCRHRLAENEEDSDEALARWLELEPTSVDANMQYMGDLNLHGRPLPEILEVFETLQVLDPDDKRPYGLLSNMFRRWGRFDEVIAWRMGVFSDRMPDGPWQLARLGTDYMNLGMNDQALAVGLRTWEIRRPSSIHFLPLLLARSGEAERAAEMVDWLSGEIAKASGSNDRWVVMAASFRVAELRDYEGAQQLYETYFNHNDLDALCDEDDLCAVSVALERAHVARALNLESEAEEWLGRAESRAGREFLEGPPSQTRIALLTAQGRHEQAIDRLREGIFSWTQLDDGTDLEFPIYFVEGNALLDPLRDEPAFKRLLDDYRAHLEPMRERVLAALENGEWGAIRQYTFLRESGQAD